MTLCYVFPLLYSIRWLLNLIGYKRGFGKSFPGTHGSYFFREFFSACFLNLLLFKLLGALSLFLFHQHFAMINPCLNTNGSVGRKRLRKTVFDISPKSTEWNFSFFITFGARNFRATQTPLAHDLNSAGSFAHRACDGFFHCLSKSNPLFQLKRYIFRNQLRIGLRNRDFFDIKKYFACCHARYFVADAINFLAAAADDKSRPCRINPNA